MDTWSIDGLTITLGKEGSGQYLKASYPVRYGRYAEIKDRPYIFQFNLNGEIKFIQGQSHVWHHNEWLKRTVCQRLDLLHHKRLQQPVQPDGRILSSLLFL